MRASIAALAASTSARLKKLRDVLGAVQVPGGDLEDNGPPRRPIELRRPEPLDQRFVLGIVRFDEARLAPELHPPAGGPNHEEEEGLGILREIPPSLIVSSRFGLRRSGPGYLS